MDSKIVFITTGLAVFCIAFVVLFVAISTPQAGEPFTPQTGSQQFGATVFMFAEAIIGAAIAAVLVMLVVRKALAPKKAN